MSAIDFRRLLDIQAGDGSHGMIGLESTDGDTLVLSIFDPGGRSPAARARLGLADAQLLFDQLAAACVALMHAQGDPRAALVGRGARIGRAYRDTPDTPAEVRVSDAPATL